MSYDRYQPTRNRILVEIELLPERTAGGIILPRQCRLQTSPNKTARVLAVHPSFSESTGVSKGDRILLGNFVNETYPNPHDMNVMILHTDWVVGTVLSG